MLRFNESKEKSEFVNRDYLEQVGPADVVHGAPGVEPVVAILPLQGRAKVNSLGPVEVRSHILELRLVTPVFGLSREKNLSHRLGSDKMSNIVKLYKLGIKMIDILCFLQ